jgi:hypothetical protein
MTEIEFTKLSIQGFGWNPVANRFVRQGSDQAAGLAVIFPGLNYSADMPLLYFPGRLLSNMGYDVLQVRADYTNAEFQSLGRADQVARLTVDARAALMAGKTQRAYPQLVLVGKSIGTLALAGLMGDAAAAGATTIWLTPLLRYPALVEAAIKAGSHALFACGTGDSTYDPVALQRIQAATEAPALLCEGANHSLELPGDILRSVEYLRQLLQAISALLKS